MRTACLLFVLMSLLATAGVGQAAIYKWIDENGTITFRDTPPPQGTKSMVVNPEPLANVEYHPGENLGAVPQDISTGRAQESSPSQNQPQKAITRKSPGPSFPDVTLYVTSWCGYCVKAKAFLKSNGVPFEAYDVEKDSRAAKQHRQLSPGGSVPVALIGGRTILGFSPGIYRQALGL